MKKLILYLTLVLWLGAIYPRLTTADEWNYPDDVPATVPTTVGLAASILLMLFVIYLPMELEIQPYPQMVKN